MPLWGFGGIERALEGVGAGAEGVGFAGFTVLAACAIFWKRGRILSMGKRRERASPPTLFVFLLLVLLLSVLRLPDRFLFPLALGLQLRQRYFTQMNRQVFGWSVFVLWIIV